MKTRLLQTLARCGWKSNLVSKPAIQKAIDRLSFDWLLRMSDKDPNGFGKFDRQKKTPTEKEVQPKAEEKPADPEPQKPKSEDIDLERLRRQVTEELEKLTREKNQGTKKEGQKSESTTNFTSNDENKEGKNNSPPPPPPQQPGTSIFTYVGIGLAFWVIYNMFMSTNSGPVEITIDQFFEDFLKKGKVSVLNITRSADSVGYAHYRITFNVADAASGTNERYAFSIRNLENFITQATKNTSVQLNYYFENVFSATIGEYIQSQLVNNFVNLFFLGVIFVLMRSVLRGTAMATRQGKFDDGANSLIEKMKREALDKKNTTGASKILFKDVAGMDEAKREITEFVDFLTNKNQFTRVGAKIPRGALLTGPPGTGKTLLAKACANESKVPFFVVSGSEFVEVYVGVGAARVRALFEVARQHAPCIIFIDEIDAIGKKRSENNAFANQERENTLNQLLVEMDGFDSNQSNIVIFGATNLKDSLDPALLRPGRFDRLIDVPLPDIEARRKIFMVHLKKIAYSNAKRLEDYAKRLASLTPGFSGAQIENICNEAAMIAARKDATSVNSQDFENAVERVIAGLEKSGRQNPEARRLVAIHESGHGVVSWFLKNGPPLLKLTVIPRSKGAGGFAQYLANENFMHTKQDIIDLICMAMAGTLAEEVILGTRSTGASDDLKKVQNLTHQYVMNYGMGSLGALAPIEDDYGNKYFSDEVNSKLDQEKLALIQRCEDITRKLIIEKRSVIEKLSEELLEHKNLDHDQIKAILGERPFPPKGSYKNYLEEQSIYEEESPAAQPEGPKAVSVPTS